MASSTFPMGPMDRSGSFFKLIDAFASEIGELKQEMVRTPSRKRRSRRLHSKGLEGEVSGLYLQSRHCSHRAGGERDSGYDSLGRRMSVLARLTQTHPVWLLLALGEEEARRILLRQPAGVFLVTRSAALQRKVLSVRLEDEGSSPCIQDFPVKESQYTFSLEHSGISFADLFRLVAFYCVSR
ncbi:ras and Rab interactor 2-like [Gadus macrocephalus]|uniref:ras and Rab interactor 2-like n=1 Tax=Gadus macrocephalus TaxID=80720 RepID=UPI0028CB2018|nr:ras and Rab interactor 2-like [Gadus macrocephalus]XP_059902511.1 ras and Rab interactor 2-like [Gadus macrocephalus]